MSQLSAEKGSDDKHLSNEVDVSPDSKPFLGRARLRQMCETEDEIVMRIQSIDADTTIPRRETSEDLWARRRASILARTARARRAANGERQPPDNRHKRSIYFALLLNNQG
jgi:hypothetical protein